MALSGPFNGLVTCPGAGWSCAAGAGGLQHEFTSSLSVWANALCFCRVLSNSSQQTLTRIPHWDLLSARLDLVPGCNCSLNAPLQSSCNHKIYNLMEIRAGVQRPCGLAVYHNDLLRSINAANRKPIPSSLTYLSFEKGQTLRLDVNNTLVMGMIKVPTCKGLGLKWLRVI